MSSNQLAFLQWPTYDQCITGTKHLSLHLLNRAFCAKDNVATPWYAVKYCTCNEISVAGVVRHNMEASIVILYDQSTA